MSDQADVDECPGCGAVGGVWITSKTPIAMGWHCDKCNLDFAAAATRNSPFIMATTRMGFTVSEVLTVEGLASVEMAQWRCHLCGERDSTARSQPMATAAGLKHLIGAHGGRIGIGF